MRFIDNEHVEFRAEQQLLMGIALGGVHGCHHNVIAPGIRFLLCDCRDAEFAVQLADPLQHE
ncbi:hypothetical protein D3C72_2133700 [compost metagenome]